MSVNVCERERDLCEKAVLLLQYVDGLRRRRRTAGGTGGWERLENGTFFQSVQQQQYIRAKQGFIPTFPENESTSLRQRVTS